MEVIKWRIPSISHSVRGATHSRSDGIAAVHLLLRTVIMTTLFAIAVNSFGRGDVLLGVASMLALSALWPFLGWAGLGHELFHGSVFTVSSVNRVLFILCSTLTWNNFGFFDFSHREHHRVTMYDGDPEGRGQVGIPPRRFIWLLLVDLPSMFRRFQILVLNALERFPGRLHDTISSRPTVRGGVIRGARITLAIQTTIIAMLGIVGGAIPVIIWLLAPFTFTFINRVLENAQHAGMRENVDDFRLNTRSVALNPLLGLIYSNMHLHVEHHMYPKSPYYRLPKLHQHLHSEADWMPVPTKGFMGALREVIAAAEPPNPS